MILYLSKVSFYLNHILHEIHLIEFTWTKSSQNTKNFTNSYEIYAPYNLLKKKKELINTKTLHLLTQKSTYKKKKKTQITQQNKVFNLLREWERENITIR